MIQFQHSVLFKQMVLLDLGVDYTCFMGQIAFCVRPTRTEHAQHHFH